MLSYDYDPYDFAHLVLGGATIVGPTKYLAMAFQRKPNLCSAAFTLEDVNKSALLVGAVELACAPVCLVTLSAAVTTVSVSDSGRDLDIRSRR